MKKQKKIFSVVIGFWMLAALGAAVTLDKPGSGKYWAGSGEGREMVNAALDALNAGKVEWRGSVTSAQRDALSGVAVGDFCYNSTAGEFQAYDGSAWGALGGGSTGNSLADLASGTALTVGTDYFDDFSGARTLTFSGSPSAGDTIRLSANVTASSVVLTVPTSYRLGAVGSSTSVTLEQGNHELNWLYVDSKWWLADTAAGSVTEGDVTQHEAALTITENQISDLQSYLLAGGDIGAATATTPPENDNDTSVATTAYVQTEIAGLSVGGGSITQSITDGDTINSPSGDAVFDALAIKVASDVTGLTGADEVTNIVTLTQAEYDAIGSPDANTAYLITDPASASVADGSITPAKFADADWGDGSISGNTFTLDNGVVDTAELADGAVTIGKISATGTPTASTVLKGDGTWGMIAGSGDVTIDVGSDWPGSPSDDVIYLNTSNGDARIYNGSNYFEFSGTYTLADVTAPNLSSAVATTTDDTSGSGSVDTDEGNGTLSWVITESNTSPSVAQVKAGNDHTGSSAADSGSQAVSGTGTQNVSGGFTGLSASTTYYAHYQHVDSSSNDSTVLTSSSFTTDAGGVSYIRYYDFEETGIPANMGENGSPNASIDFDATTSPLAGSESLHIGGVADEVYINDGLGNLSTVYFYCLFQTRSTSWQVHNLVRFRNSGNQNAIVLEYANDINNFRLLNGGAVVATSSVSTAELNSMGVCEVWIEYNASGSIVVQVASLGSGAKPTTNTNSTIYLTATDTTGYTIDDMVFTAPSSSGGTDMWYDEIIIDDEEVPANP